LIISSASDFLNSVSSIVFELNVRRSFCMN
jgi:hypothetical protein